MPDPDECPPGFGSGSRSVRRSTSVPSTAESAREGDVSGTVMAFDFGTRRIGVAVGETATRLAHPLSTVTAETTAARFEAIGRLIDEWRPTWLLVGLPVHMDGNEHQMTARARRFARQLEGRFGVPVQTVDERLSTADATEMLHDAGVAARRQMPVRDQVAAQTFLQSWLDQDR